MTIIEDDAGGQRAVGEFDRDELIAFVLPGLMAELANSEEFAQAAASNTQLLELLAMGLKVEQAFEDPNDEGLNPGEPHS